MPTSISAPVGGTPTSTTIGTRHSRLTINGGLRWDFAEPVYELHNRLASLDVASGFAAIAPVLPGQTGALTGLAYGNALVNPDRKGFQPRIGLAWRPFTKGLHGGARRLRYLLQHEYL